MLDFITFENLYSVVMYSLALLEQAHPISYDWSVVVMQACGDIKETHNLHTP